MGRAIKWHGKSRETVKGFPEAARRQTGVALHIAQLGGKAPIAKPLQGFDGVFEIVANAEGDAYRAVYAIKIDDRLHVLHAFMKKSKTGIKTPRNEIETIRRRLKEAKENG